MNGGTRARGATRGQGAGVGAGAGAGAGHVSRPSAEANILDTFEVAGKGGWGGEEGATPPELAAGFDLPPPVPGQALGDRLRAWARGDGAWSPGPARAPAAPQAPGGLARGGFPRGAGAGARRVAADGVRLIVLAFRLARALVRGGGWLWIEKAVRLILYAVLLLPGFVQVMAFYFGSGRVIRGIRYGARSRNTLDVYLPSEGPQPAPAPVVVFLTGGAWIIGYKAWGALIGRDMAERGVLVVSPDYRNFPEAHMAGQLSDVDHAIAWTLRNCTRLGGDPENVTVVGQSCGAHLGILSLFRQVVMGRVDEGELLAAVGSPRRDAHGPRAPLPPSLLASPSTSPSAGASDGSGTEDPRWWHSRSRPAQWDPGAIRQFVGVSGPYNLRLQERILHGRGLKAPVLDAIIRGADVQARSRGQVAESWEHKVSLATHSPVHVARSERVVAALQEVASAGRLPSITLLHGEADATVPYASSVEMASALREDCALEAVRCVLFPRISHTGPLIECPMRGDDPVLEEILDLVLCARSSPPHGRREAVSYGRHPMVPAILVRLAAKISPF